MTPLDDRRCVDRGSGAGGGIIPDAAAEEADLRTFASTVGRSESPWDLALRQIDAARLYGAKLHRDGPRRSR